MEGQGGLDRHFQGAALRSVRLRSLNFDGDRQADLSVHGGPDKAAYVYASEHYAYWKRELPDMVLPWGIFGENLTTEGLNEEALQIGDRFRIGSAEVAVTQPRLPCFKLGLRFGRDDMLKRFLASGRLGFYFRVVTEGDIAAGDEVLPIERARDSLAVSEITRLYARDKDDLEGLQRMVRVAALPDDWRDFFKRANPAGWRAPCASLPPSVRPGRASVPSSCRRRSARAKTSRPSTSCRRTDNHCRRISRASS